MDFKSKLEGKGLSPQAREIIVNVITFLVLSNCTT